MLEHVKTLPEEVVDKLAKEVETLTILDLLILEFAQGGQSKIESDLCTWIRCIRHIFDIIRMYYYIL